MLEFKLTDHRPWWKQVIHGITLSIGIMLSLFAALGFSVLIFALISLIVETGYGMFLMAITGAVVCVFITLLHDWSKT